MKTAGLSFLMIIGIVLCRTGWAQTVSDKRNLIEIGTPMANYFDHGSFQFSKHSLNPLPIPAITIKYSRSLSSKWALAIKGYSFGHVWKLTDGNGSGQNYYLLAGTNFSKKFNCCYGTSLALQLGANIAYVNGRETIMPKYADNAISYSNHFPGAGATLGIKVEKRNYLAGIDLDWTYFFRTVDDQFATKYYPQVFTNDFVALHLMVGCRF